MEKNVLLVVLFMVMVVAMLLTVSCAPKQFVCPNGKIVSDPNSCGQSKPAVTKTASDPKTTTAANATKQIPTDIQQLLDKSEKVVSLSYSYDNINNNLDLPLHFWIKGDIVKRELPIETDILYKNELDVVIFDTAKRTATGYCESHKYCKQVGKIREVDYDQYYIKTPFDWIEKTTSAEKVSEEVMFKRDTWKIKVNGGVLVWVDSFYGIPLKVDEGNKRYEYGWPLFNQLSDSDVAFSEKDKYY